MSGARLGRALLLVPVLLVLLATPGVAATPAGERGDQPPAATAERVLLFSMPRVTWADFTEAELPHLTALLRDSMVGQLSPRTAGSRTTASDGYATIGAGNRADGAPDDMLGGYALSRDEQVGGRYAYQAFQARVGHRPDGNVLHLGVAEVHRQNQAHRYGAQPGELGGALNEAGLRTAVVANADMGTTLDRSAALAVMDREGMVDGGRVDPELLRANPTSPYGFELDHPTVIDSFTTAWRTNDVVLVEASDLERADAFGDLALPEAWQEQRRQALVDADRLLGDLLRHTDPDRDLVMVMTPAGPRSGEELGVFGMAGPGVRPGVAVSGTTRRNGYLTLPDIAPTVLQRLGIPVPPTMTGTPVSLGEVRPVDGRMIDEYVRANEIALFRDRVATPVTVVFIVLQVLAYVLASLMLVLRRRPWLGSRSRRAARILLLTVLAIPTTTFLSGLVPYDRLGAAGYLVGLVLGAAALAAGAIGVSWLSRRRLPTAAPLLPPLLIVTITWITMIVDVLFYSGRLQLDTVFGYSPIVAGRFSGYGNFAFSLVAICAVVMVTGAWAIAVLSHRRAAAARVAPGTENQAEASGRTAAPAPEPSRRWRALALVVVAAVLIFTVVVDGYPAYGSDIGGVLAAVPSFALVLLLLAGVRINVRRLALVGVLTVATIGVFALADMARPPEAQSHLGRLVSRINDTGGLATVIERKLFANLSILGSSIWTWVVPIGAAFLVVLSLHRFEALGPLLRRVPGMAACLWGALVVAVLGFALNDSGIAVPAMMSTILLPYLGYLILRGPWAAVPGDDETPGGNDGSGQVRPDDAAPFQRPGRGGPAGRTGTTDDDGHSTGAGGSRPGGDGDGGGSAGDRPGGTAAGNSGVTASRGDQPGGTAGRPHPAPQS